HVDRVVAGGVADLAEPAFAHRRAIDPEAVNGDTMNRSLFGIMPIRAHPECAARNEDHPLKTRRLVPPDCSFTVDRFTRNMLSFVHDLVGRVRNSDRPTDEIKRRPSCSLHLGVPSSGEARMWLAPTLFHGGTQRLIS